MNSNEIAQVMDASPDFRGVWPCCEIDRFKKESCCGLIVNTDPHNKPGAHWVGIYKRGQDASFFDSFGRDPAEFEEPFASIMKDFFSGLKVNINSKQYQDDEADTCGHWSYYYVLSRICGVNDFSEFTNDTVANEIELIRQMEVIKKLLYTL